MLQQHRSTVPKPFLIALAFLLLSFSQVQAQSPCETALLSSEDILDIDPSDPVVIEQGVSEWDSDILKIRVRRPGVFSLKGEEAEGSLQKLGDSGLELVNGASLGAESPLMTLVIPEEVYCLRIDPRPGATGDLEIEMELVDLCQLDSSPDDHGDSFACATTIELEDEPSGSISEGDRDVFAFSLETGKTVEIQSDGAIDTAGRLYDETGALLDSDEDSGPGSGFLISATLPAGSYFIRVESSNNASGTYTLSLNETL